MQFYYFDFVTEPTAWYVGVNSERRQMCAQVGSSTRSDLLYDREAWESSKPFGRKGGFFGR